MDLFWVVPKGRPRFQAGAQICADYPSLNTTLKGLKGSSRNRIIKQIKWVQETRQSEVYMEFLILDLNNIYQLYGSGFILGFGLQMIFIMITALIHLFKDLTKCNN